MYPKTANRVHIMGDMYPKSKKWVHIKYLRYETIDISN